MFIGIGLGLNQGLGRGGGLNAQLASAAGIQPTLSADIKSGQAWLRGAPYALTSVPGWSFSRALAAYGETSGGVLVPFASGAPRLVNGRGQLIEGARTNLCLRSQEFDNASWTKAGAGVASAPTVTANFGVAPDGTQTADRIQFALNGGTATADISSITSANMTGVTSSVYASSFWIKSNDASTYVMQLRDIAGSPVSITVTPTWQRVSGIATAGGTSLNHGIRLRGGQSPTNSDTADILLWESQCELGGFISSNITTTTASVTRPADIPLIDISAYSPAITYPLTMYARFERVVDTGGNEAFLQVANTGNDQANLSVNGSTDKLRTTVSDGGVTQADISSAASISVGVSVRAALRIATNDINQALLGVLGTQDVSAALPADPIEILLGTNKTPTPCFGYLSEFAIIPGAVSDANLQRLAA